ncbi:thioredoxin-like protein [Cyathus striatus]|nr:thioredoxin-like protein [Cyathus striatus]
MASFFTIRSLTPTSSSRLINSTRHFHISQPRLAFYPSATKQTFDKVVGAKDRVVLVDFYADWCGPCLTLAPVLKEATAEPNTSGSGLPLDLVQIDIESDEGLPLAHVYKVTALPTVIAFKNGENVSQFIGASPPAAVQKFIKRL